MFEVLTRVFDRERGGPRDGRADALSAQATGLSLDPLPAERPTRRERVVGSAESQIADVVAEKVLKAWLQNRHQVILPLAVDLSRLPADHRTLVLSILAASLACDTLDEPAWVDAASWLRSVRADESDVAKLTDLRAIPLALPTLLAEIADRGIAPLAFVAVLVGTRRRSTAARLFADYVAARLGLSASIVRAARRRYAA